ncbi:MAG: hypothetical protein QOG90_169 [Actinomycetota bacterium]|jgi:putative FmdB family regulatory protein
MPTYEYECKKCGERFDVVQSFTDDPLKRHKGGCGGSVKRVFGSVGISFKGSGFYKTDNRSSSSSSSSSSESKSETKSEPKTETKTESKPEKKPEPKSSSAAS